MGCQKSLWKSMATESAARCLRACRDAVAKTVARHHRRHRREARRCSDLGDGGQFGNGSIDPKSVVPAVATMAMGSKSCARKACNAFRKASGLHAEVIIHSDAHDGIGSKS